MPEQWLSKFTKEAKTLKWKFHVVYIFPCERRSVKTNGDTGMRWREIKSEWKKSADLKQ